MSRTREIVRRVLPAPVRRWLRMPLHYAQRNARWLIILWQLRGASWRDQGRLLVSALAAPVLSLRGLSGWQDPVLLYDVEAEVRGIGRFRLRRWTDDLWHVLPWREREIHRELRRWLGNGGIFVDAGANIGIYTVLASRLVGPEGRVLAIEMVPETATILRSHVGLNRCGNVVVVERALADRVGDIVAVHIPEGRYGQASILPEGDRRSAERSEVTTTTLDHVCQSLGRIDLLKMDLEGAEKLAIAGASATLSRLGGLIVETLPCHDSGILDALDRRGFQLRRLGRKDVLAVSTSQETCSTSVGRPHDAMQGARS